MRPGRSVGRVAGAALVALLSAFGCGGKGSSSGPTGLMRNVSLPSLSAEQKGALCDWINASVGG